MENASELSQREHRSIIQLFEPIQFAERARAAAVVRCEVGCILV
jgi:hypothetical protein